MKPWLKTSVLAIGGLAFCTTMAAAGQPTIINEVVYDNVSSDTATWVEILGPVGQDLTGWQIVGVNGNGGSEYKTVDLVGSIPASGYFVVSQDAGTPNSNQTADTDFQNGPDSIVLRDASGAERDALGYGNFDPDEVNAGEGNPAQDVTNDVSLARCPDGSDTDDNATDFFADDTPTPGERNDGDCTPPTTGACCFTDGGCAILTADDCAAAGGDYQGDDAPCDPNPCDVAEPTDRSLCEVAADDADGLPVLLGEFVRVRGVAMNPSMSFGSGQDIKITDGECCMTIFDFDETTPVAVGDEIEVIGFVDFFNGLTEVSGPDMILTILSSGNPLPAPNEITTADLAANGEDYESCLIQLTCVTLVDGEWPAEGDNSNITVDDGSGPAVIRIDRDTDIDGSPAPTGPFTSVGLGGQFDSSAPYDEGYQMFPRNLADITFDDPNCGPMPKGACCDPNTGECSVVERDVCAESGGDYQGDGTVCDPNPCDPIPVLDKSWGEIKGEFHGRK